MKKIKLALCLLLSLAMLIGCGVFNTFAASSSLSGSGTEGSPYMISTPADIDTLRSWINSGKNCDSYYKLASDIDMSGVAGWKSIGNSSYSFTGVFDGNGKIIRNLNMGASRGFFCSVDGATIKDLGMEGITLTPSQNNTAVLASLVGVYPSHDLSSNTTNIINCHIDATVNAKVVGESGYSGIGGFVGRVDVQALNFENCTFSGSINGDSSFAPATDKAEGYGGFIGRTSIASSATSGASISFKNCANLANITANKDIGGFIGNFEDYDSEANVSSSLSFKYCYNAGTITATAADALVRNVFIAHYVGRAHNNGFKRTSFENCFVLEDAPLIGGKEYSIASGTTIYNDSKISQYALFGYNGSDTKYTIQADHFGANYSDFDIVSKSELFLMEAEGELPSAFVFQGFGEIGSVIGRQEATSRASNGTYSLRLVGMVSTTATAAGFTLTNPSTGKSENVEVQNAYRSLIANGETVNAPDGYFFITLVLEDFSDDKALDFTVYTHSQLSSANTRTDVASKLAGARKSFSKGPLGHDHYVDVYSSVSYEYYNSYCKDLVSSGYKLYQSNDADGNLFGTYFNSSTKKMMHVYWLEAKEEMRVVYAEDFDRELLDVLTAPKSGSGDVTLYMLPALSGGDGGLGFIITLADGRYIIIDGGVNNATNAKNIYNYVTSNGTKKAVIASWIITHAHMDHMGALYYISENGDTYDFDKLDLQTVLFNSCNVEPQSTHEGPYTKITYNSVKKINPDVKIYKPFAGQKFTFATTTVEIFFTIADYYPNVIDNEPDASEKDETKGNGNLQTMVFSVDLKGDGNASDKLMVMGDATSESCNIICERYSSSYITCDYVQVSHHGHSIDFNYGDTGRTRYLRCNNSTTEFYSLVDPKYAFWATGEDYCAERRTSEVNKHLDRIVASKSGKHYYAYGSASSRKIIF